MDAGLFRTVAAMQTHQQRIEIVASNIANVETAGFKRMLHVAHGVSDWARNSEHDQVVAASTPDFQQGVLQRTGEELDLAIDGPGFFVLEDARGEYYTRDGTFSATQDGVLVSSQGNPVAWKGSRGIVDPQSSVISVDGTGQVLQDGIIVGQLRLVEVDRPEDVQFDAQGQFRLRSGAEVREATGLVHQGFIERANVQTVDELVELIAAQRSFELAARTFKMIDRSYQRLYSR